MGHTLYLRCNLVLAVNIRTYRLVENPVTTSQNDVEGYEYCMTKCSSPSIITSGFFLQMTAEALHRLVSDPVLPFYPLDIALDVQNKLKGRLSITQEILDHEKRFKICQNVIQWERKKPELEGVMDRELAKSRLTLNAKCMKLCVSLNSHWLAIPTLC